MPVLDLPYEEIDWTPSWRTDVIKTWPGPESRISVLSFPREVYGLRYLLEEPEMRELRRQLYLGPADEYQIPLEHESMVVVSAVVGVTVVADTTYSDWIATGQPVLVRNLLGQSYSANIVSAIGYPGAATILTLSASPPLGQSYPGGSSRILPLAQVDLDDGSGVNRYQVNVGAWSIAARDRVFHTTWGTGAPAAVTFAGLRVLDRRPLNETQPEEQNQAGLERLDLGASALVEWSRVVSDLVRFHEFMIGGEFSSFAPDRQWWRAFLFAVRGRQVPFLLPTWRDDLPLAAPPVPASFTLLVTKPPDYAAWFAGSAAQDRLLLVTDEQSGQWTYTGVSGVVDNLDGTETITTTVAVPPDPIEKICFLETVRLEEDAVPIGFGSARGHVTLRARVVQR